MTLRALEMPNIWMQILRGMFVEIKRKKKAEYYFTLLFHSFISLCKAPLTKPVSVVLVLSIRSHPLAAGESLEKEKSLFISHTAIKNAPYKQVLGGVLSLRSMTLNLDWI